jgi:hypothetical protein
LFLPTDDAEESPATHKDKNVNSNSMCKFDFAHIIWFTIDPFFEIPNEKISATNTTNY